MSVAAAEAVLAQKAKTFALAAKLLAPEVRSDVAVLYAYCRRADDMVDDVVQEHRLSNWERLTHELDSVYDGQPQSDPLLHQFQALVKRRRIPIIYPRALLDGLRSDLGAVRLKTMDELLLYSYRVAGVVGVMMCYITGVAHLRALDNAVHLGIAMQLTNICRDVDEDWRRERLYLPSELLMKNSGSAPTDGFHGSLSSYVDSVAHAREHLLALADRYYISGEAGLSALPPRVAFAVRTARHIYAAIGSEVRIRGYHVLAGRAVVPMWKKLLLVGRAFLGELRARCAMLISGRPLNRMHAGEPQASGECVDHTFSLHL